MFVSFEVTVMGIGASISWALITISLSNAFALANKDMR